MEQPQYNADGNQTLIKTSTGIWSVTYNAENRPVRWESGDMVVTMNFDRMGRRTLYLKRDYLDVKLHYEDNLPPFIPLQSELEKLWSDWQKAKMDLSNAKMEMVKCKLKK